MFEYLLTSFFVVLVVVSTVLVAYSGLLFFFGLSFKGRYRDSNRRPFVSILVAAKNEQERIDALLSELTDQDYPVDKYEIIVAEDGSRDSTRDIADGWARRHPDRVKLVTSSVSTGKPAALNRAFSASTGEIIGVIDADSTVEENLISEVARVFESDVFAVQGETSIMNRDNGLVAKLTTFEHEVWTRFLLRGRAKLNLFVPCLGNLSFVRRSVLEKVGGWDMTALAEDVELSVAMWVDSRQKFEYHPEITCKEVTVSKVKSFYTQRMRWYGGYIQSLLRHGNLLRRLSPQSIDGELLLAEPLMGVVGLFILALGISAIALGVNSGQIISWLPYTAGAYSAFSSIATFAALKFEGERHAWKLIPAIYLYWALQSLVALSALVSIVSRKQIRWVRTEK